MYVCSMYQGMLTFEGDALFARNEVQQADGSHASGIGGALSNIGSGSILFKGQLTVEENAAWVRFELHLGRPLCPW